MDKRVCSATELLKTAVFNFLYSLIKWQASNRFAMKAKDHKLFHGHNRHFTGERMQAVNIMGNTTGEGKRKVLSKSSRRVIHCTLDLNLRELC